MKKISIYLFLFLVSFSSFSQSEEETDSLLKTQLARLKQVQEREKLINYQTDQVEVNGDVKLDVPKGYKFMSKDDANYVVCDFWGNPPQEGLLGLLVKEDYSILNIEDWAFIITYDASGYVKDEDAEKLDYDEMMSDMKKEEPESNKQRLAEGYPSIHMLGWATKPYYDKENNILHWAKSMKFDDGEDTTLNYDVRVLGRRGILSLNAVGVINQLNDIKAHIPEIIHIAKFKEGSKYSDFTKGDKIAAYTIGGLVAGKLLAKVGIIALLLKNIKLIMIGIAALFGTFGKKIFGFFKRKKHDDYGPQKVDSPVE